MRTTSRSRMKAQRERLSRERSTAPVEIPQPDPAPEPETGSRVSGSERLSFALRNDGTIDTDNMRSATRDKLKAALSDASLHERIGLSKPRSASDGALPAEFNLHVASILHDTLSKLVAVMVMKSGYPPEQAKQMLLTAEEKQTLDPLLGNVLNDWLPTIEGKYQSLALLGAGYFSVYNTKALMLRKPAEVIPFPQAESSQVDATTDAPSP